MIFLILSRTTSLLIVYSAEHSNVPWRFLTSASVLSLQRLESNKAPVRSKHETMVALYGILTEHVCPRQQYLSLPVSPLQNPSYTDLFPTKIRYCVGERCLDIAIISMESDAGAGSTQSYRLSEDAVYLSALLFSTTVLLWATVFISSNRRNSKRTEKYPQ